MRGYRTYKVWVLIPLLAFLVSCNDGKLFQRLPPDGTGIHFTNAVTETESLNILEYLYMYNGGGVAIGDVNNDGLPDIYLVANQQANQLYLNKGGFKFEDITEKAGVAGAVGSYAWTNGVTMADINADGWLDIYLCRLDGYLGLQGKNQLYINNQDGTFTEQAAEYGLDIRSYAQEATFFDMDLDGDLDMFLVNMAMRTPSTYKPGNLRAERDSVGGDRLYENLGDRFVDISKKAGIYGGAMGYGLSVGVGDLNNDRYPDIYVANDFHENDYLYYNQGDGTFSEQIVESMGHTSYFSMGNDIADVDNDGWPDIFTLDMKPDDETILKTSLAPESFDTYQYKKEYGYHDQFARNMLQINQGNLFGDRTSFSEVGEMYGLDATDWSWGVLLADFDLDGKKDIFITNGIPHRPNDLDYINYTSNDSYDPDTSHFKEVIAQMPDGKMPNVAYRNKGNGFEEVSNAWGLDLNGHSNGSAYADLDNDGDLDLVLNNLNAPAVVYRNLAADDEKGNFLKVRLKGSPRNTSGFGAKVTLNVGDTFQVQELYPVRGWLSSVEPVLVFGLGKSKTVDRLEIDWKDGKKEVLSDLSINSEITLDHSRAIPNQKGFWEKVETTPFFARDTIMENSLGYVHQENEYIDFDFELLLPRKISTAGPKMAFGDINNDGLQDIYIGGAKNQPGTLYIQQENGDRPFRKVDSEVFYKDRAEEDVDAVFVDVDRDGLLDLYVVSGSGEALKDFTGRDRLYRNIGNNEFQKSTEHPQLRFNGSCVAKGDFNKDGVTDLFVGGRSVPGSYGKYPSSRILLGSGGGKLYDFTLKIFGNNFKLGMVTDAVWLEDSKELIVVGDWMPITRVDFSRDTITINPIKDTSGWWNTLEAADLDGDGDKDLLAGNLGLNSYLKASPQKPVNLYVKDFDNNSSIDPIMTHYPNGEEVPFFGMDVLAKQLVPIKKLYTTYESYASSTFKEIFNKDDLHGAGRWQARIFESLVLMNKGPEGFVAKPLPQAVQVAPIYGFEVGDFDGDGHRDILAVGNFYGNQVGLGKFDASYGHFLKGDGQGHWYPIEPEKSGFAVKGQARDIAQMETASGENRVLVARNNDSLRVFGTKDRGHE